MLPDIRVENQHHRTDAERAGEDDRDDSLCFLSLYFNSLYFCRS